MNKLTRFLLPFVLMALALPAAAQVRIAVFNSIEVFNAMPEKAAAETKLQATSSRLQAEYKRLQSQLDQDYADYQAIAADPSTPATIIQRRLQQIQESDKHLQEFQDNAAEELRRQRETLMTPLLGAIQAAVGEVGDQSGYDLIIDTAKTPVAYTNSATVTDITAAVKTKLGIK